MKIKPSHVERIDPRVLDRPCNETIRVVSTVVRYRFSARVKETRPSGVSHGGRGTVDGTVVRSGGGQIATRFCLKSAGNDETVARDATRFYKSLY